MFFLLCLYISDTVFTLLPLWKSISLSICLHSCITYPTHGPSTPLGWDPRDLAERWVLILTSIKYPGFIFVLDLTSVQIQECFHTRADSKLRWRIVNVIVIFEVLSVHTREKNSSEFAVLKRGEEAWLISVFFWHADCYSLIWDRISITKCAVYRRKRLEGHVAPPPKLQFRVQRIHTMISLRDLRDTPLENTSGPSFELHNSNYANLHTHRPKYCHLNDQ